MHGQQNIKISSNNSNVFPLRRRISALFMIEKTIQHSYKIASNLSVSSGFEPEIHFII